MHILFFIITALIEDAEGWRLAAENLAQAYDAAEEELEMARGCLVHATKSISEHRETHICEYVGGQQIEEWPEIIG